MDFLNDEDEFNLELPQTTEINRDLFANETSLADGSTEEDFDVDEFLMKNNFNYVELDPLIRDMSGLSNVIMSDLLNQISNNYESYLEFFQTYTSEDNDTILEFQRIKSSIAKFKNDLETLTQKNITESKEVISDTVEYLRRLDDMSAQLRDHKSLADNINLSKDISKTLHAMCGIENPEELLCSELIKQLRDLVNKCESQLSSLEALNSPYIHHFYNEYQGLVQEFQLSLKILTDRCLSEPTAYTTLSKVLISLLNPETSIAV